MGLFRKSPAEKKLKELTGGNIMSKEFKDRLKRAGLPMNYGVGIRGQLKKEIKEGKVNEDGLEQRLEYLINERKENFASRGGGSKKREVSKDDSKTKVVSMSLSEDTARDDKVKEIKFLINQEHNVMDCPKCAATILKSDRFCYRCGANVILGNRPSVESKEKSKSDLDKSFIEDAFKKAEESAEVLSSSGILINVDGSSSDSLDADALSSSDSVNAESSSSSENADALSSSDSSLDAESEEKSTLDELSELEKLYNKKVSTKYTPKFKFAYVLYLDQLNKKPSKKIPENTYVQLYDAPVSKLEKQALEDGFIGDGNPLAAAQSAKVSDIKDVLREHELKVSGKKDDLIERLGENLSEEELKKAFPQKVLSVTEEGLEFIEKNRYVFYYDDASPIRTFLDLEEYDSIFYEVEDLDDENILKLLIDYLQKRENELADKSDWAAYRYNFVALARVYKDSGDDYGLLDADFKLFIAGINNFSEYTNQSEPYRGYIGKTYSKELIDVMNSLSLDIDELKDKFSQSYDELRYPELKISKDESLLYLLKLFGGEEIGEITSEIHSKYPVPDLYQVM